MPDPVFSDAWAKSCAREIAARVSYRQAAATWEGAVLLVMMPDAHAGIDAERTVFLDLWHGDCREARVGAADDPERASFVLAGTAGAWRQVLSGRVAPLMAIMTGRLRLTKGSLTALIPFAHAAKELVAAASAVPTEFPAPA